MFQKYSQITLSGEVYTNLYCYDNVDEAISYPFYSNYEAIVTRGNVHKMTKATIVTITIISRGMDMNELKSIRHNSIYYTVID